MQIEQLLTYLVPPSIGALIGYTTNKIAIRMLFRPLKPWRLFGIRIPLTPGVLPAKRTEFANRIGKMVGRQLLSSDDVGRALEKEDFRRQLKDAVGERLSRFLASDTGTVASLIPDNLRNFIYEIIDKLRREAMRRAFDYLDGDACAEKVRNILHAKGEEALSLNLHSLVGSEMYDKIRTGTALQVRDFLLSKELAAGAGAFIDRKTAAFFNSERTPRELLPARLTEGFVNTLEKEVFIILDRTLNGPDSIAVMKQGIVQAMRSSIRSMEGLPGLLASFIDVDWILARFPDFPDRIAAEVIRGLENEKTRRHIGQAVRERVNNLLDRPLSSLLEPIPFKKAEGLRRLCKIKILQFLHGETAARFALSIVADGMGRLGERSLGSVLEETLSEPGLLEIRGKLADAVIQTLRSPAVRESLDRTIGESAEKWFFDRPIGRLSDLVPSTVTDEFAETVYLHLAEMLRKEVPPLLDTLNVERIVEEKVNSLDILKMESLLLGIMEDHFKYINLFGALLGFLIGAANVIITLR